MALDSHDVLSSSRGRASQEEQIWGQGSSPKYEFRAKVREGKMGLTTWLDQDSSGDYEPELDDVRQRRPVRPKGLPKIPSGFSPERVTKKPKTEKWEQKIDNVLGTPAVFNFSPKAGRDQLEVLGNPPENWLVFKSGIGRGTQDLPLKSNPESSASYRSTVASRRCKRGGGIYDGQQDKGEASNDITNSDPAAKGCKACFTLGLPCSLLQEGSGYPCDICAADSEECELIVEPLLKQACQNCKRRKIACSYRDEVDHRGPCKSCVKSSIRCVAGPLRRRRRARPPVNKGSSQLSTPLSQQHCQITSSRKRRHKDLEGSVSPPRIVSPYKGRRLAGEAMHVEAEEDYELEISREDIPKNAPHAVIRIIRTRLAHPVNFNYEPKTDEELIPCHWCDDLYYGLVGLGAVDAEVIDYRDGRGYEEVGNGHTNTGHLPSRMCTSCTLDRFIIIACIDHQMQPILNANPESPGFASFMNYLAPGKASSAPFGWCSICPTPASYYCCQPQGLNSPPGDPNEPLEGRIGCGLLLCGRCEELLTGKYFGVLERLIEGLSGEQTLLRADVDFLHPNGELLRRFDWASG